jgi:hypothetical protein
MTPYFRHLPHPNHGENKRRRPPGCRHYHKTLTTASERILEEGRSLPSPFRYPLPSTADSHLMVMTTSRLVSFSYFLHGFVGCQKIRCHPHQETQAIILSKIMYFFISSFLTEHLLIKLLIIYTIRVTVLPAKPQQALLINIEKIAFLHTFYLFYTL